MENTENKKDLVIALGFFDGVHVGHCAVLNSAVSYAKENGLESAVITFINHPKCFFSGSKSQDIISQKDKMKIFMSMGLDNVYFLSFDENLAKLSATKYLELLCQNFNIKAIFTGFNHTFGANREGNAEFLRNHEKEFGYKYFEIDAAKVDGKIVSSSLVRENLSNGNIEQVNKLLGRKYSLTQTVVEGEKIGRTIGFRTANLLYSNNLLNISRGVYTVEVTYNRQKYRGVANFGMRPSLGNTDIPILEVHILDFDKDIYGEEIKVDFVRKIRDEQKFNSLDELKNQIAKDTEAAKK